MKTKVMPVFVILLTLAIAFVSIVGCETNNAGDDSSEETTTNGIDGSDTTSDTTTESISEFTSSTSEESSVENSVPDITGMTATELKRFALNYEINNVRILTYVGDPPTDESEHREFVWNVQNLGDFDITIVYSFCYNLVDPEDPDFFNPDVQELKTEVVKIYAPAHSEGVYLPEPGYKNRSGNDAVSDGGAYLGIEFAGVYYTLDELYS